jgi:hypothetical protein
MANFKSADANRAYMRRYTYADRTQAGQDREGRPAAQTGTAFLNDLRMSV